MTRWLGPYQIDTFYYNGSVKIKTIDEERIPLLVNGHRLKLYKKPLTREEFIQKVQEQDLNLIGILKTPNST
jgi:hypothetical protein